MNTIELTADIDDQHELHVKVPKELPVGPVRVILLVPDEDQAGGAWTQGIAIGWSADLRDPAQDIYTLDDGQPVNERG